MQLAGEVKVEDLAGERNPRRRRSVETQCQRPTLLCEEALMNDLSTTLPSSTERNWAVAAHVSGFIAAFFFGIGAVLAPLIIWVIKKDELPFVADQAREALNFQITVLLAGFVCWLLVFVLIGIPMLFALGVFDLVCCILAAIKASEGVAYRYPITLRLIR
jgi:uncharacterized protein